MINTDIEGPRGRLMNGELKDYASKQLSEVCKRLELPKNEADQLAEKAWDLATKYMSRLKPNLPKLSILAPTIVAH